MTTTALAIDIGATKIEAGVVDEDGTILARHRIATPQTDDANDVVGVILEAVNEVVSTNTPTVCGIGVCGSVDGAGNAWTLNIPSFRNFQLGDSLRDRLAMPLVFENDARAMTLAEGWMGAAKGCANYLALVVSTGVGGGIVLDGKLLKGNGRAGRVGHICVDPDGRLCECGHLGCLEAEASGKSIETMTGISAAEATSSTIERTGMMVGRGISLVANLLDLDVAVIGGSVALGYGEPFFAAVRQEAESRNTLGLKETTRIRIKPVGLGADAPLLGATAVALATSP